MSRQSAKEKAMPREEEGFVVPPSPSKRGRGHRPVPQAAPESPDMKNARNRLGNLLSGIKRGDIAPTGVPTAEPLEPVDEGEGKQGRGRPKKQKREKRIIFELRGKPFGLRDSAQSESIYTLCRKWMYGKDEEPEKGDEVDYPPPAEGSLDLLATKDIHALPLPRYDVPLMDPRPQKIPRGKPNKNVNLESAEDILADYQRHWKRVKSSWTDYNAKREERYSNSIQLLRTVYGIAQQNQM
ncbi:abnormal cell lineage protein 37 [Aphelenchoides avenae]|nr:abnormal cell lineage protein 37 [Aphelenchus avenae]